MTTGFWIGLELIFFILEVFCFVFYMRDVVNNEPDSNLFILVWFFMVGLFFCSNRYKAARRREEDNLSNSESGV